MKIINYLFYLFIFSFINSLIADEIVTPIETAQRYLNADLVIIGTVLSIDTHIVNEIVTIESESLKTKNRSLIDFYYTKIDSVIKGHYEDSIIIIQSNSYSDNIEKIKFKNVNSNGDSTFEAEISLSYGSKGGVDLIKQEGKYIILVKTNNGIFASILCYSFSNEMLQFFNRVSKEGIKFLLPPSK